MNTCGHSKKWTVKSGLQLCQHQSASTAAVIIGAEGAACGVSAVMDICPSRNQE